jgi:DNA gyrase subunit B
MKLTISSEYKVRGKPLNAVGKDITEVMKNKEYLDLINSVGTGVDDYHDTSEIRYGKIILMADAD